MSTAGGAGPMWGDDGKELFFLAPDGSMMSVSINSDGTFDYAPPARLFGAAAAINYLAGVSADGQRFLVNSRRAGRSTEPFTVVLNWTAELNR